MNISTIYQEMENRNNLHLPIYLSYLQEHVNSPSFSLDEVLGQEKKYLRALACAAFDVKKPELFFKLITQDSHMKVFTSHMVLIKCSAELLNVSNSNEDLERLLEQVIYGILNARLNEPGTTLSFAIGFVLGTAIKRGVNIKSFFNRLNSTFITDNNKLFNGLHYGLSNSNTILVLNEQYLVDLTNRYDNWDDRSRILSLSIFKAIPVEKIDIINMNENNLKVLEYFSGRNNSYDKFLSNYIKNINNLHLQKEEKLPKQVFVEPLPSINQNTTVPENDNNSHNPEQQIVSLQTELALYKSIFKQFETLFPDLEKTLQMSGNNQDLLNKINSLIGEQKNNIKNLQHYYEESEKQKAIKDNFKKIL